LNRVFLIVICGKTDCFTLSLLTIACLFFSSVRVQIQDKAAFRSKDKHRSLCSTARRACSQHAGDEGVDLLLTVAPNTTLDEGVSLLLESLKGGGELEGPQEVVGFLEGGAGGPDLVDEVLNGVDSLGTEGVSNDSVVGDGDSGAVDLTVASLVDELADGVAGGVAVGDVGLDEADHVDGGAVETDEDTVMELSETEELHDLLALGAQLVDTKHAKLDYIQ